MEKGKMMMMVIIVLLVILLGAIGGVSWYVLKVVIPSMSQDEETNTGVYVEMTTPRLSVDQITLVDFTSAITTNLRVGESGENRYAKLSISIGVNNTIKKESEAMITKLQEMESISRDIVYEVLRNMTYEDISNPQENTLQLLKDDIKGKLQNKFDTNLIYEVYIVDIQY